MKAEGGWGGTDRGPGTGPGAGAGRGPVQSGCFTIDENAINNSQSKKLQVSGAGLRDTELPIRYDLPLPCFPPAARAVSLPHAVQRPALGLSWPLTVQKGCSQARRSLDRDRQTADGQPWGESGLEVDHASWPQSPRGAPESLLSRLLPSGKQLAGLPPLEAAPGPGGGCPAPTHSLSEAELWLTGPASGRGSLLGPRPAACLSPSPAPLSHS